MEDVFCGLSMIGNHELLEVFEMEISREKRREDYNIVVGSSLSKLCHANEVGSQLRPTCWGYYYSMETLSWSCLCIFS